MDLWRKPAKIGLSMNRCLGSFCRLLWLAFTFGCVINKTYSSDRTRVQVEDIFGRTITQQGLVLVDWEGYIANPAIKFFVLPPTNATFPATATLSADGVRLYFDLPSTVGSNGPAKSLSFSDATQRVPVQISIFPDRDTLDENYSLSVQFRSGNGATQSTNLPIHVIDQDTTQTNLLNVTLNFSQDKTGFFTDARKRQIAEQAASDWAYFFDGTDFAETAAGSEYTYIWDTNGFVSGQYILNGSAYLGFLLYGYGIDSAALRSGGEGSFGGFQSSSAGQLPLRRSGGFEAETQGNYNTLGWFLSSNDDDWWRTGNLGGETNDFYSIAHHEIGHALMFHTSYPLFAQAKTNGGIQDPSVFAYHGSNPRIDASDHFNGEIDDASRKGAFGYEYFGDMPRRRWLFTKLDLLCGQAIGYKMRATSAFIPLRLISTTVPDGAVSVLYSQPTTAHGGIPFYNWEITAGALPPGLSLNPFTGQISGTPAQSGTFNFTLRLRDYRENASGVSRSFTFHVAAAPSFRLNAVSPPSTSNHYFHGQLIGTNGQRQTIESSLDLQNWFPFATNTAGAALYDWFDTNAPLFDHQFYRGVVKQ